MADGVGQRLFFGTRFVFSVGHRSHGAERPNVAKKSKLPQKVGRKGRKKMILASRFPDEQSGLETLRLNCIRLIYRGFSCDENRTLSESKMETIKSASLNSSAAELK
jgi:hypothetical protein